MQMKINRTINLPDQLSSVNDLEQPILEFGRELMAELMEKAWKIYQEQQWCCQHCGSREVQGWGSKPLKLRTVFGRVELRRKRVRCRACGRYSQPLDALLCQLGSHHATWAFQELASLCGVSWPYKTATEVLAKFSGDKVSVEGLRQMAEEEGARAAQVAEEKASAVVSGQVEPPEPAQEVEIALDGGWVHSRDNPQGMEGKVSVVYNGVEKVGKDRCRLVNRRYAATFAGSELLGKLCYADAFKLGVEEAERQAVLGDGAAWISSVQEEHFPKALRILDFRHLNRRLWEALHCWKEEEVRSKGEAIGGLLWNGKVDEAIVELQSIIDGQQGEKAGEFLGYVENNREWIVPYRRLQEEGYPVGSGAVEKGVDLVINRRLKGRRGMRWRRENAEAVVALRVLQLNEDWDAYWHQHWLARYQPVS